LPGNVEFACVETRMSGIDFERVFQGLPGLFLILLPDPEFTIAGASDAYLRATLTERKAIVGRPLFEVFPDNPDDPQASGTSDLRVSLERVIAGKAEDTMPVRKYDIRRPESRGGGMVERYWAPVNAPVLSADGGLLCILHRVEDVTARVREEQELRATEILESIAEGFFTLDTDWRFSYVNRAAQRILESHAKELVGKVIWDVYPGLEGSDFESTYRRVMAEHEPATFTAFYPGHGRWYEASVYPAPGGIAVYFRNVTERKEAEAERARLVAESENQRRTYEAALSNTPDFIYVFGLDHRCIYANEALVKTWGRGDVRGKSWLELGYEPWHAEMHQREMEQVIATGQPVRNEIPFTGTNGRRIYDYIFVPVFGPEGEVVAVAGTTRDITERKEVEQAKHEQAEQLREADRAKDEFLATLSHELRNPLAPLRNSLHLLRSAGGGKHSDASFGPIHEMMERQVNHLVRLVDDLLEMSRISRGAFALRKERVAVAAIARNAVETSDPLIQAAGHKLSVSLPEEAMWVEGDPVRLAQIVANLLNNAAKYTDPGGSLALEVCRDGAFASISVRDNGCGIAPESMPRMFEMFSRGDRASGRGQGGLGIGLALSRRLAEMHAGTLEGRSAGAGRGSEFTLRLPLTAPQAAGAVAEAAAQEALPQKRILVVDDNRDAAESLGMVLKFLGADVRVARDGPEALEEFHAYDPAVVLLDIGMPGMDGYEVARRMRKNFPGRRPAIVALTGWGQEKDRLHAREAGFDHHLIKPAEIGALQALLASLDDRAPGHPEG
jgi:PAS domain S-box-containing protein